MVLGLALAIASARFALPPCKPAQLSLAFDGENGAFDGMSHSGALLVIRNLGPTACALPTGVALSFRDSANKPLPIARSGEAAPGLVGIAVGAEVTAPLRWVSGEVYDRSRCLAPARAVVTIGAGEIAAPFAGRMCGSGNTTIRFDQPALKIDPTLLSRTPIR